MKIQVHSPEQRIVIDFDDLDSARTFLQEAAEQAAFLLHLEEPLRQFQPFEVDFKAPPRFSIRLQAEVVQVFPAGTATACAFSLKDWTAESHTALKRRLQRAAGADKKEDGQQPGDTSPAFRIQSMNTTERLRLATKASRTERQILLRDSSPQVLYNLLSHPRIADSEVRSIVASNFASAAIMQRVVKNKRWMGNPEILLALVRSPKTPPPLAIKQMNLLRTSDLQILAKANSTREAIRKAALRIYLQRTGQSGRR